MKPTHALSAPDVWAVLDALVPAPHYRTVASSSVRLIARACIEGNVNHTGGWWAFHSNLRSERHQPKLSDLWSLKSDQPSAGLLVLRWATDLMFLVLRRLCCATNSLAVFCVCIPSLHRSRCESLRQSSSLLPTCRRSAPSLSQIREPLKRPLRWLCTSCQQSAVRFVARLWLTFLAHILSAFLFLDSSRGFVGWSRQTPGQTNASPRALLPRTNCP